MAFHPLRKTISEKKNNRDGLFCRPLNTFSDVKWFLEQPPAWRTLCKELTPHSKNKLKNMEIINSNNGDILLEAPATFCHYDPDAEDVVRHDEDTLPQTLVCHDMANGYHDDSNIEGTTNYEFYTFYNWAGIDIFCYFSHHFITIPPVSWINVAHAHGVKVIGTVITEWNEGVEIWDRILSSESEATEFATTLVTIASLLKFDGWLMNIENKISKPESLLNFLSTLHGMLHKEREHAVLIWYDSVTVKGNLNWQNGLNDKNKAYFDACDGIFTNYSWDQGDLKQSVEVAGDRIKNLYIGVDVWGRNFYGGGHLNTQEAVSMIYQYGCSVALFAPAWTHETLSTDQLDINGVSMSEGLDKCALFYLRDRALWGSLWPFLSTRVPCQLPFRSSFCRGMGRQRRMYGEVLCNAPWYNLRHQQYQPNSAHGPHGYLITAFEIILQHAQEFKQQRQKGILRYRDSFQSGSCLRKKEVNVESHTFEWIIHDLSLTDTNSGTDEDRKHNLPSCTTVKHVHGPPNDKEVTKPEKSSSDSSEDGKKKAPWRSVSGSTLIQSVKKMFSKLRHHKSLSELIHPPSLPPAPSQSQGLKLADSQDQDSALNQVSNIEDVEDQRKITFFKSDVESSNSEAVSGAQNEISTSDEDDPERSMDAGPSEPLVARTPDGKSMQQMSVKLRLGARHRRAHGLSRVPGEMECLELWLEDSFNGGACLRIHPSDEASPVHRHSRLFHCDFPCEPTMLVCVVTKPEPSSCQSLNIVLKMMNVKGEPLTVVLVGRGMPQGKAQESAARGQLLVSPLDDASLAGPRAALLVQHPACYVPFDNDFGWRVRYYKLTLPGCRITSVCCHALLNKEPILLGHFAIVPLKMG